MKNNLISEIEQVRKAVVLVPKVVKSGYCAAPPYGCGLRAIGFRDTLSKTEYKISGLCQKCQDKIYEDEDGEGGPPYEVITKGIEAWLPSEKSKQKPFFGLDRRNYLNYREPWFVERRTNERVLILIFLIMLLVPFNLVMGGYVLWKYLNG